MSNVADIKKQVLNIFHQRHIRLTPSDLEHEICSSSSQPPRKVVRSVIKEMVADGSLQYTNHFNTTHLELTFNLPIQVSERIYLLPGNRTWQSQPPNALCIRLDQGSSFGIGDHPTTRLALQGVDYVMRKAGEEGAKEIIALDIGTGSGVLAMAAVGLGAARAVGLDIDPVALHEADKNIELNKMEDRIELSSESMENLAGSQFSLVMANLRPPTLRQMMPLIKDKSKHEAYWVFSGCRQESVNSMLSMISVLHVESIWQECSCGWVALVAKYRA